MAPTRSTWPSLTPDAFAGLGRPDDDEDNQRDESERDRSSHYSLLIRLRQSASADNPP